MKNKSKIRMAILAILGIALIGTSSCKKNKTVKLTPNDGTVKDADGNVYHTAKIGEQVWMLENLKTTKYNDGTPITNVTDNMAWGNLTTGAYCWYNNDDKNKTPYGALYNFYAVKTGKLCPTGWHVPSDAEWKTLETFLGGADIAGGQLKEIGTVHWEAPNSDATNSSGFTALPGGVRTGKNTNGAFNSLNTRGFWWSSTPSSATNAILRVLVYNVADIGVPIDTKSGGTSVRCIKDK